MTRRISTLIILSFMVVAFAAMSVNAASEAPARRTVNPLVNKVMDYSLPYPDETIWSTTSARGVDANTQALGKGVDGCPAPGFKVGNTWYDYQHNGRMARMVDWYPGGLECDQTIHFEWMELDTEALVDRSYAYQAYDCATGGLVFPSAVNAQSTGEYGGYVSLDVTEDGRAVLGGHRHTDGSTYYTATYWDFACNFGFFGNVCEVPDSVWQYGQTAADGPFQCIWPTIDYQELPGMTPVLHMFSQESAPNAADPQAIYYFRKVGYDTADAHCDTLPDGSDPWDYPPYVVDTVFDIAQMVDASRTSQKVVLAWTANIPAEGDCDTCSNNTGGSQLDNDVYYQVSADMGASWGNRVNLTKNVDGEDGYRPYTDLTLLINSADQAVVGWSGRVWPADANAGGSIGYDCRMFVWSEALGFDGGSPNRANFRTVASLEWDQEVCNGGAWQMNGSKMTVSECDGRLYYIWTQFNDIPNGVTDDCAQRGIDQSDVVGSANGELFLSVCNDLTGLLWDAPRNLTNTYTPGCDSIDGVNGRCCSEHWSSMAEFGGDFSGAVYDDSVIYDPSGSYTGDLFLPVQYIEDPDAGGIVQDEGTWKNADVMWFQLACVEPEPTQLLAVNPAAIEFPAYTKPGTVGTEDITIENVGNTTFTANASVSVTTGPSIVAITTGGSYTMTAGGAAQTVTLQFDGTSQTGTVLVEGDLTFSGSFDNADVVVPFSYLITDTIIAPKWTTAHVDDGAKAETCPYLTISNAGNKGNQGNNGSGTLNMDYFNCDDCDVYDPETGEDPYLGESRIYLYDGSKVLCWDDGGEIVCNGTLFDWTWVDEQGFTPGEVIEVTGDPAWLPQQDTAGGVADDIPATAGLWEATYYTHDTSIMIQELTIGPEDGTGAWMINVAKYTNVSGSAMDLAVGEVIDWDVPADSGSDNNSGFDFSLKTVWQQGVEYDQDEDECLNNDVRFGGMAFLGLYDGAITDEPYGMFCMDNASQIYPDGGLVEDSIWKYMEDKAGYTQADSLDQDLHMVATYAWDYTLDAAKGSNLVVYSALITTDEGETVYKAEVQEAIDFYEAYLKPEVSGGSCPCCVIRGDINHDGVGPDIADLVHLVSYMFQPPSPAPVCESANPGTCGQYPEADINGDLIGPDIADLVHLVSYMFQPPSPAPADCP